MRTLAQLAEEAIAIQDACNLSGVVHSLDRTITDLRAIARAEGWENTPTLNNHPIVVMYVNKLSSLCNADHDATFAHAYEWCNNAR